MNNNYYKVVEMLKKYLDNIPSLNTKVFSRSAEKDLFKNSIYPLAHVNNAIVPYQNWAVNTFSFEVGVLDQRIIPQKQSEDKWTGDSNIIDTFSTTYSILIDFLSQLERGDVGLTYDIVDISGLTPLYIDDTNGLDGWVVTITINLPNDLSVC